MASDWRAAWIAICGILAVPLVDACSRGERPPVAAMLLFGVVAGYGVATWIRDP